MPPARLRCLMFRLVAWFGIALALGQPAAWANEPAAIEAAAANRPGGVTATPRLRLDAADSAGAAAPMTANEETLAAIDQANVIVREAIAAAMAHTARMAAMEQQLTQLRSQAQAQDELVQQLRAAPPVDDPAARLVRPLLLALLTLGLLAAWLAWQLRSIKRKRLSAVAEGTTASGSMAVTEPPLPTAPRAAASVVRTGSGLSPVYPPPPDSVPIPPPRKLAMPQQNVQSAASGAPPLASVRPAARVAAASVRAPAPTQPAAFSTAPPTPRPARPPSPWPPPESPSERSRTLALPAGSAGAGARDVSVEELIDLEQQAEFFIVLGQDDAAVDLLVDHLRQTGGASPLPYLKLLEIYRRRGDHDAYQRTRSRFNRRFNAYAPDWADDLQGGRTLEDYQEVIGFLQSVWPRPLDAMAELESFLFRRDGDAVFDLPAYREVLFLYQLARDVLDRESAGTGNVDVLLPLGGVDPMRPGGYPQLRPRANARGPVEDHPTSPVDLEISGEGGIDSLFGIPEPPPPAPRRR